MTWGFGKALSLVQWIFWRIGDHNFRSTHLNLDVSEECFVFSFVVLKFDSVRCSSVVKLIKRKLVTNHVIHGKIWIQYYQTSIYIIFFTLTTLDCLAKKNLSNLNVSHAWQARIETDRMTFPETVLERTVSVVPEDKIAKERAKSAMSNIILTLAKFVAN